MKEKQTDLVDRKYVIFSHFAYPLPLCGKAEIIHSYLCLPRSGFLPL